MKNADVQLVAQANEKLAKRGVIPIVNFLPRSIAIWRSMKKGRKTRVGQPSISERKHRLTDARRAYGFKQRRELLRILRSSSDRGECLLALNEVSRRGRILCAQNHYKDISNPYHFSSITYHLGASSPLTMPSVGQTIYLPSRQASRAHDLLTKSGAQGFHDSAKCEQPSVKWGTGTYIRLCNGSQCSSQKPSYSSFIQSRCRTQQCAQASTGSHDEQSRVSASGGSITLNHRSSRSRLSMSNGYQTQDSRGIGAVSFGKGRSLARYRCSKLTVRFSRLLTPMLTMAPAIRAGFKGDE